MRADYIDGYYYVSSDSDSLEVEEISILRVEAKEFESFVDNFILARALNNSMGIQHVEIGRGKNENIRASLLAPKRIKKFSIRECYKAYSFIEKNDKKPFREYVDIVRQEIDNDSKLRHYLLGK